MGAPRQLPGSIQEPPSRRADDGTMAENGTRVLVVDDEPSITDLVALALRYEGFAVEKAATGRAALASVDRFKPDLIVLDVMLPDLSGIDVLRRLSADGRRV